MQFQADLGLFKNASDIDAKREPILTFPQNINDKEKLTDRQILLLQMFKHVFAEEEKACILLTCKGFRYEYFLTVPIS